MYLIINKVKNCQNQRIKKKKKGDTQFSKSKNLKIIEIPLKPKRSQKCPRNLKNN